MNARFSSVRLALSAGAAVLTLAVTGCAADSAATASSAGSSVASAAAGAMSNASSMAGDAAGSAMSNMSSAGSAAESVISSGAAAVATEADIAAAKASLISSGKITTCTHLSYAPFQSNDDSGKTVGFDVDMIDLVAKKLGVTQEIVDTPFEGIKTGQDLSTGKCDIAAAGMTITEERQKVILFSDPYFDATQALLVRSGDSYATLADLKGKKVGAQAATTGLDYANKYAAEYGYTVVEYTDLATEQQGLASQQAVDAAINDLPVWSEYVKTSPGVAKITAEFDTGEQYGYGMKLGNESLKKVTDAVIAEARADGGYDAIYKKWIGDTPVS